MPNPKGRILCSEDDEDTRSMIVLLLTGHGFEVVCTENAEKAIEQAKNEIFDLFLIDSWLPGMTGTDLCEAVRKFDVKTPILFYSGAAYETDKEAARLAGAQGYVVKPAFGDELVDEVVRLIAESKLAQPMQVVIP